MAEVSKFVQERLEENPDAVECAGCTLLYLPEKYDGEFIVNVIRLEGDPPGMPGSPLCNECLQVFHETGQLRKDAIVVNTGRDVESVGRAVQPPLRLVN